MIMVILHRDSDIISYASTTGIALIRAFQEHAWPSLVAILAGRETSAGKFSLTIVLNTTIPNHERLMYQLNRKSALILAVITILIVLLTTRTPLGNIFGRSAHLSSEECQFVAFCYGPCRASPERPSCDEKKSIRSQHPACHDNCICREICSGNRNRPKKAPERARPSKPAGLALAAETHR
ncbi:hypothetical protein GGR50DRAFT_693508 [Xylaria sp. CBS 124048]|nr:hypothetical protein GGR50DRAFT_693508 [Xylaria sp. CBS 124048]